ncbi:MAG TPA: hypothetical protein VKZ18_22350 [Polyangia bacterium]|nr:hypothetical protein [Polyangia bacterium]
MFSRAFAIMLAPALPAAALILSFGSTHTANALIAGSLATLLAGFALVDRRFGTLAALVGAWVALTAFIFPSTFVEQTFTASWGITIFTCLGGPLSDAPRVTRTAALPATPPATAPDAGLPLAA